MTSRERVAAALDHREPDRVPLDLGATAVTGISASALYRLRLALGLSQEGDPVRVTEPYQMLGEVTDDLREALGIDTQGVGSSRTLFGWENKDWRPWRLPDGTPVLVPAAFNTEPEPDGSILQYPEGDRSCEPCARMPAGGYYFDTLCRQPPLEDEHLNPEDNLEEFQPLSEEELAHYAKATERVFRGTDHAIVCSMPGVAFGDIALVPAMWLKHPRGIRDVEEWYASLAMRKEYVKQVFAGQLEVGLANLARIAEVTGDRIQVAMITGTDFGTQRGLFASLASYRELFKPYHKAVNDWVHANTAWRTFIHSCGAIEELIEDFIEAGFDILNPVQCSAAGMEPRHLKEAYGDRITFWGGGVDTQKTLPFGTPEEVRREVLDRLEIFAPGGGFVFNTIHNIQQGTPPENLIAMFQAIKEFSG